MIVSFLGDFNQEVYVVCPRAPITVAELRMRMLQRARVIEGSYAYGLVDKLHSAIFVRSLNLKADYEAFFSCEYGTFSEYLRRREGIPATIAATLGKVVDRSSGVYHFDPWTLWTDTHGLELLKRLVEDTP